MGIRAQSMDEARHQRQFALGVPAFARGYGGSAVACENSCKRRLEGPSGSEKMKDYS
jgi:hypothetical protein